MVHAICMDGNLARITDLDYLTTTESTPNERAHGLNIFTTFRLLPLDRRTMILFFIFRTNATLEMCVNLVLFFHLERTYAGSR